MRTSAAEPVGVLRIGALPTVATHLLAAKITRYTTRFSHAHVSLDFGLTGEQLESLARGRLDLVASVGPLPGGDLDVQRIGEAAPVAVYSDRLDVKATRGAVSAATLRAHAFIAYGAVGDLFFDRVWQFVREHDIDQASRIEAAHIAAVKALVREGAGISILPGYTAAEPGLTTRKVVGLSFSHPIWIATRRASRGVPLVDEFRALWPSQ